MDNEKCEGCDREQKVKWVNGFDSYLCTDCYEAMKREQSDLNERFNAILYEQMRFNASMDNQMLQKFEASSER